MNGGKLAESARLFADRGHKQVIAGYYDVDDLGGFTDWDAKAKGPARVKRERENGKTVRVSKKSGEKI